MARVLTSEEKQALSAYQPFIDKAYWAVRDHASFMATNDGSSASTEALRITWAKSRQIGVSFVLNGVNDQAIPMKFASLAKNLSLEFPAVAPIDNAYLDSLIAVLVGPPNQFEVLAIAYFDLIGETINMNVGG